MRHHVSHQKTNDHAKLSGAHYLYTPANHTMKAGAMQHTVAARPVRRKQNVRRVKHASPTCRVTRILPGIHRLYPPLPPRLLINTAETAQRTREKIVGNPAQGTLTVNRPFRCRHFAAAMPLTSRLCIAGETRIAVWDYRAMILLGPPRLGRQTHRPRVRTRIIQVHAHTPICRLVLVMLGN